MPVNDEPRPPAPAWWAAAALVFCLLATLNAGGYRFGVADHAFYLPAIERHLVPESFPRDRVIIDDQDRLNVFTAAMAAVVRLTGVPVDAAFAAIYLATLLLLFGGAAALARTLGLSPWAQIALAAALTLRHRVGMTGANTLESYAHPRLFAFAIGAWAVVAVARGRTWRSFLLVAAAFVVHPTTALWFGVWVGVAAIVVDRARRPWLVGAAILAAAVVLWALAAGPLRPQLAPMDAAWRSLLDTKDYLFPTAWPATGWLMAALYVAAVIGPHWWRRRRGLVAPGEDGIVAGLLALLALFVVSVPATAAGVALAVQFQVSRVLWMFDVVGTAYVVWLAADGAPGGSSSAAGSRGRRAMLVALVLVAAAAARGAYVKWVEHPERPLAQIGLPQDDWQDVMNRIAGMPIGTHVLADPGHAWRFGTSVRVAAGRDVFLEEVKDSAMAMYSRRVAALVLERIPLVANLDALTAQDVRALAARYDLDVLVSARPFDLPVAYRNATFVLYDLRAH
jgi:hypothetical protein